MHTDSLPPSDRTEQPDLTPTPGRKIKCNEILRQRLRALRASSPVYSNSELGKKLNYSSATISLYLADPVCKYHGNIAAVEKSVEDFLQALERRRASGVETSPSAVADHILEAFEHIRKTNDLGAIVAESGEGKTRGIELICKKHILAVLIEVTEWNRSIHGVMTALWNGCAVDGWDRQTERFPYLVQTMRGSDRPIIFDDAHKLSSDALSLIATFQEKTNCPVALIGIPLLVKKLEDDPTGQRTSRVGIHWPIAPKNPDEKLLIHMVRSIAKDNNHLDELIELCQQVAAHHGHFRAVHKQLKLAAELRQADDDLNWPAAFRQAHTHLLRPYKLT